MKRICVVTGGANGIGRAVTETFLKEGYFVFVIDTDREGGGMLLAEYGNDNMDFFAGDIGEQSDLDAFLAVLLERYPVVDVLVNNACVNRGGLFSCGYDDFNYVFRVGVAAPFYLTKQLRSHFAAGASVVNISSTRAQMSQTDTESYTAAKGGISALTHAMSVSLSGRVRVNSISPGWIDTGAYQKNSRYIPHYSPADENQHTAGRVGVPDDIAQMVLFLCSEKAGFINGENITIDGGMTKLMIYHNDYGWKYDGDR